MSIRIGINTGSVISGVVGTLKPQFCLFGDTVNTASRMQSTGIENRVHISDSVYQMIKQEFQFEQREVQAKGKGLLTTYLVGVPLCKRGAATSEDPTSQSMYSMLTNVLLCCVLTNAFLCCVCVCVDGTTCFLLMIVLSAVCLLMCVFFC